MKTFKRALFREVQQLLNHRVPLIQAIVGPRQVGKSTIAEQIAKSFHGPVHFESADSSPPFGSAWIEAQWNIARIKSKDATGLLILDEIQKIRGWSETVKKLWDEDRREALNLRVLILGSSALLLQDGLTESLTGRFYLHRCNHWSFVECREAFDYSLDQWIFFGGYPGGAAFIDNENQWKSYIRDSLIETTISRDVLQMQKVSKPALLRDIFFLSARFPAQILAYNKMIGQLQDAGNTTTVAHYLDLLASAFLVSGLQSTVKLRRASSPKLILWNNGLVSAINRHSFQEALADTAWWGRLVENAVGAYILNSSPSLTHELNYWREKDFEIDFCVTTAGARLGIEVKSGRLDKKSAIGRFSRKYPRSKTIIVGTGGMKLEDFFSHSITAIL